MPFMIGKEFLRMNSKVRKGIVWLLLISLILSLVPAVVLTAHAEGTHLITVDPQDCTVAIKMGNTAVTEAKKDDIVTVIVTPAAGMAVKSIQCKDKNDIDVSVKSTNSAENQYEFTMPDEEVKLKVVCATQYDIDYSSVEHGTVAVTGNKTKGFAGEEIKFTVTPGTGYVLKDPNADVKVNGKSVGDGLTVLNGTYTWTMTAEKMVITVDFTPSSRIALDTGSNGTVTSKPAKEAYAGQKVVLTITPDPGYTLENVSVKGDDGMAIPVAAYTGSGAKEFDKEFTMPGQNVTAHVSFKEIVPNSVNITPNPISVPVGASVKLTADVTPATSLNKAVEWSVEDPEALELSEQTDTTAVVTVKKAGTAKVIAASQANGKEGEAAITGLDVSFAVNEDAVITGYPNEVFKSTAAVKVGVVPGSGLTWKSDAASKIKENEVVLGNAPGDFVTYKLSLEDGNLVVKVGGTPNEISTKTMEIKLHKNVLLQLMKNGSALYPSENDESFKKLENWIVVNNPNTVKENVNGVEQDVQKTAKWNVKQTYKITVAEDDKAASPTAVTYADDVDAEHIVAGNQIYVTVNPKDGYVINEVKYNDKTAQKTGTENKYGFMMPASDVTVTVTYKKPVKEVFIAEENVTMPGTAPVEKTGIVIPKGATVDLFAVLNPSDADNNGVNIVSDTPAVATVTPGVGADRKLTITAVDVGKAKITVSSVEKNETNKDKLEKTMEVEVVNPLTTSGAFSGESKNELKVNEVKLTLAGGSDGLTWKTDDTDPTKLKDSSLLTIKGAKELNLTDATITVSEDQKELTIAFPANHNIPNQSKNGPVEVEIGAGSIDGVDQTFVASGNAKWDIVSAHMVYVENDGSGNSIMILNDNNAVASVSALEGEKVTLQVKCPANMKATLYYAKTPNASSDQKRAFSGTTFTVPTDGQVTDSYYISAVFKKALVYIDATSTDLTDIGLTETAAKTIADNAVKSGNQAQQDAYNNNGSYAIRFHCERCGENNAIQNKSKADGYTYNFINVKVNAYLEVYDKNGQKIGEDIPIEKTATSVPLIFSIPVGFNRAYRVYTNNNGSVTSANPTAKDTNTITTTQANFNTDIKTVIMGLYYKNVDENGNPLTGDSFNPSALIAVIVVAVCGIGGAAYYYKKKK